MKFEFGDLYKFIVSLGVVLITISITVPWLFLREPFDLLKTEVEIKALTEVAQNVLHKRQTFVSYIFTFLPWLSFIGSTAGIIFIYLGLKKWQTNQNYIDRKTKIEVEIQEGALREATKDEIQEKIAGEAEEALKMENSENKNEFGSFHSSQDDSESKNVVGFSTSNRSINKFTNSFNSIENIIANRLSAIYRDRYLVKADMRLGNFEVDILLQGNSLLVKDYVIEVKYIRKGFNFGWLKEAFLKNLYMQNEYARATNKKANTLLLIVLAPEAQNEAKYSQLLERLKLIEVGRNGKDIVRIINEAELTELDDISLKGKLSI
ncbi:hypothetical protein tinsulaeT_25280 [Thalassotalea insulae]|uniref:PD-(D/E)XK nuclease superfamily protein n=1 Tax=Thalassotalea insulae TaxID=2056778 RepID=A0ABQ6GTC0_9GAMM|nr:hypothetical protein [Thalassotalea insulae]GLX79188.1 hypothetical protein tinsulaeT_25280 [Thalassotalea insulae]